MNKIKILVMPSDRYGCGYWRSVQPHRWLSEHLGDFFDVTISYEFPKDVPLDQYLQQFDILHIHKQLDKECKIINLAKFLGLKVVVDVDDNWNLGNDHPMSASARAEHWEIPIINHLRAADLCTTTTSIFGDKIKKVCNPNVAIFPNAIDPTEKQFIPKDTRDTKRLRLGLICGSSHMVDFKLIRGVVNKLPQDVLDKIQIVLCGFDTRGNKTIRHLDTGQVETRPIQPTESVWYEYEKIVTDNYKTVSPEHKDFLMKFIPQSDYPNHDEAYRRCWTKDISEYATHYNNIDVLLVPLAENDFNKVKSQLKVVEAGFFHKAIVASNFGPYTIDLKPYVKKGNEIDESGNALLCDLNKGEKQWVKWIKLLADNPDMVKKLQDNLYETVKDTYSLETVCKQRAREYAKLLGREDVVIE